MTYEYVCTSCGHAWEAEQPISAPALKTCPSCGADTAKRQISGGAGFILKGGGWYADGYGPKKTEKTAESKDEKKKSNGNAAKSEAAKPVTKTETPASAGSSKPSSDKASSADKANK